jgi:polyhydroxyalkanoate synthesis regulator phasin
MIRHPRRLEQVLGERERAARVAGKQDVRRDRRGGAEVDRHQPEDKLDGVSSGEPQPESGGVADGLRTAVERTIAATAGTAAETRGRAQELLDEVARRGQRTREGFGGIRFATAQELRALENRIADLESRLEALEVATRATPGAANPKPKA